MLPTVRGVLFGVCLGVALAGCGGGEAEPEGPVSITGSAAIDGYLDAICTFLVRAGGYPKKLPCAQGILGSGGRTLIDLGSAIATGTVIYHPDLAAECAAKAVSLPCTQTGYQTLSNDCSLAFEATVAVTGSCHSDFECLAGTRCSGACAGWEVTSCCTGACDATTTTTSPTTMVFVADGEACTADRTVCENLTSYCNPSSGICTPRLSVGASCQYDDACILYALCDRGTCRKRPTLGENCKLASGGFAECLPGGCDSNNVCVMTNFVAKCF